MTRLRPAREHEIGELAAAVREPAQVAAGRAVLEIELDLLDLEAGADGVDRHPRLDAEAHRDGEHGRRGRAPSGDAGPRAARAARGRSAAGSASARPSSRARGRRRPAPRTPRSPAPPRTRRAAAGRRGDRRRRAGAGPARAAARRASAPGPCRGARAGSRARRPPRRARRSRRASRRRRRRSRLGELLPQRLDRLRRSGPPRHGPRRGP